jgi:carbonic anhydrase
MDVKNIREYPLLQRGVSVAGAIYHVDSGHLELLEV